MKANQLQGTPVSLYLVQRGVSHFAIAALDKDKPKAGRGQDRESAIADALPRNRIFYANSDVERDVVQAQARHARLQLLLIDDVLHLPAA